MPLTKPTPSTRYLLIARALVAILLLLASCAASAAPAKTKYLVFVGTYTADTTSKGIYAYSYDAATHQLASLGVAAETANPSFLAVHPNHRFLYAVNELSDYQGNKTGGVSAFSIDHATAKLTFLNEVPSGGTDPCYVSLDKTGKYVFVANYTSGSVSVFSVLADGRLGERSAFDQHTGHGVNPKRQEGPHAHSIDLSPDNRFAIVDDLGLDEVMVYRFSAAKGTLAPNNPPYATIEAGSGPRHFTFAPNGKFAYVISEMKSTVTAFSYDPKAGALHALQTVSTLPQDFSGQNDDAEIHIHPSGKFLYASNRGSDSITVFAINPAKGTLTLVENVPTGGKTPRNFVIDPTGARLFAANQDSNNIVAFSIDSQTGRLTPTGQVFEVASPVSILFVEN